jgi:predicted dehydrogenase
MTQNRRNFLQTTSMAGGAVLLGANSALAQPSRSRVMANDKINVAFIGIGGRGRANLNGVVNQGKEEINVVALCDVDDKRAGDAYSTFPEASKYYDYRKMFDEMHKDIDAVVISTPDHTHFHPSHAALELDKHLYLEKPMAHNVWEVRQLTELARERGVATQLGVQRHTIENMHRVVEWIHAGFIGEVTEVYSWIDSARGMPKEPGSMEVPDDVKWDLWLGPARSREYHNSICPYGWRFWWDYGTGEMGNWGCHILDIPYWALGLKYPTRVWAEGPEVDRKRTPQQISTHFDFPAADGRGPVTLHWSQDKGGPAILKQKGLDPKGNNTLFIGEKGMLLCGFGQRKLLPEADFAKMAELEPTIEKSPGFYLEWINAMKGGPAATCNFDYSGPMTETVLLGNVAYRAGGEAFDWDAENLQVSDNERAQMMIKDRYRSGWRIE